MDLDDVDEGGAKAAAGRPQQVRISRDFIIWFWFSMGSWKWYYYSSRVGHMYLFCLYYTSFGRMYLFCLYCTSYGHLYLFC